MMLSAAERMRSKGKTRAATSTETASHTPASVTSMTTTSGGSDTAERTGGGKKKHGRNPPPADRRLKRLKIEG